MVRQSNPSDFYKSVALVSVCLNLQVLFRRSDTSGDSKISLDEFLKEMGVAEQKQPAVELKERPDIAKPTTAP